MSDVKRVDFFIAGVQKGGTTALHRRLGDHPGLFLPDRKEVHFFDNERVNWRQRPYDSYHQYFDFTQNKLFGEATPNYIYWPKSLPRMQAYNPDAKIIVLLRHPTFRALSAWKMERSRGTEHLDFGAAISLRGRARVWLTRARAHRRYSYVEKGQYAGQIRRLLRCFPRSQVLFLTSEQLWQDEAQTLDRVCAFLGIDRMPARAGGPQEKYVVPVDSRNVALPDPALLASLSRRYRGEIRQTAEMTGLDLDHWLDAAYQEPMRVA
jgi:hypothetical protein